MSGQKNSPTNLCRDCKMDLHPSAKKCKSCGSYQDIRRYIMLGRNSLALVLSFIAILTTAVHATTESYDAISEHITNAKRPLDLSVVSIQSEKGGFLIANRTPNVIVVDHIQCALHLLVDSPRQRLKKQERSLSNSGENEAVQSWMLNEEHVMGVFLVSFDLGHGIMIQPQERETIFRRVSNITPPIRSYSETNSNDYVANYCFASGVDEFGKSVTMMALITKLMSVDVDLLEALKIADFRPDHERRREEIISEVRKHRGSNGNESEPRNHTE